MKNKREQSTKKRFNKIIKDIKSVKIQGARSIAKAALYAYSLNPIKKAKRKLINARPTEPLLVNVLNMIDKAKNKKIVYKEILHHFDKAQEKINKHVFKLIKSGDVIFTHCHSTNVVQALIYSKKHRKKFEVYNTETRPLYQGRKTARELRNQGIKVTTFIDFAVNVALEKKQGTKKADKVFLGADAILKEGAINKIGSAVIAELAYKDKTPLYIIADSWKFSPKNVKIEERDFHEVWKKRPKKIKIKNPAFEQIPKKHIKAIISEFGTLSYSDFLEKVKIKL